MKQRVYITAIGKYLPGKPISNDKMETYLGCIHGKPSRTKNKMLQQNGITTRYYALDENQNTTISNTQMTANAIADCLTKAKINPAEIEFLSAATTQNDVAVPGFASMVHAETQIENCEIASHQSVCASGMMAIQNAYLHIHNSIQTKAIACAGDLPSRMFKAKRFENQNHPNGIPLDTDFLRWMLSDGAGSFAMQNQPSSHQISFEIEWIELKSHAHKFDVCMYTGLNKNRDGSHQKYWMDYDSFSDADKAGAINLKQDLRLVNHAVSLGVQHLFELVDNGKINPKKIDWLLCHYSSEYFKQPILDLLQKGGLEIHENKWFTNLHTKGNTGAASIFIMLEELMYEKNLSHGQEIICMVPESGRFITSFMKLKVVKPNEVSQQHLIYQEDAIIAPDIDFTGNEIQEQLVRKLVQVWVDFETELRQTSFIQKIYNGKLTLADYKTFLLNLRQQVIDGSQWIARAASNVDMANFDIRSSFISHSSDEHRDYQILEKNYIHCGGKKEDLYSTPKNIGSEALSAYMFHQASRPNPFHLLGGMYIIEGLGNRIAGNWGRAIKEQLSLNENQVSFFTYHETSDSNDNHFERFTNVINSELLTQELADKIVKTAKVVGKLYVMQIQEIGNF